MSNEEYDYTAPDNPIDDDSEVGLLSLPETGLYDGKTVEEVDRENQFVQLEDGEYVVHIHKFEKTKDGYGPFQYDVTLDGVASFYWSNAVDITWKVVGFNATVQRNRCVLPPANPEETRAFTEGYKDASKPATKGFWARCLRHMLGHLGFVDDNGQLLPGWGTPNNWKTWPDGTPRYVRVLVKNDVVHKNDKQTGEPVFDAQGKPVYMHFPKIELFKFSDALEENGGRLEAIRAVKAPANPVVAARPAQPQPAKPAAPQAQSVTKPATQSAPAKTAPVTQPTPAQRPAPAPAPVAASQAPKSAAATNGPKPAAKRQVEYDV